MIKFLSVLLLVVIVSTATAQKNNINSSPFDFDWKFALNDHPGAERPEFNDTKWGLLDVPHDFSIEHFFDLPLLNDWVKRG